MTEPLRPVPTPGVRWDEDTIIQPEPWMREAACRGHHDLHFPDEGMKTQKQRAEQTVQAIAMCRMCPVMSDCLRYALEHGERHGIWAGTTPAERAAVHELKRGVS